MFSVFVCPQAATSHTQTGCVCVCVTCTGETRVAGDPPFFVGRGERVACNTDKGDFKFKSASKVPAGKHSGLF